MAVAKQWGRMLAASNIFNLELAVSELLAKKRFSLARPRGVLAEKTTIETYWNTASSIKVPKSFSWGTSEAFDTEIVTAQRAATRGICMP